MYRLLSLSTCNRGTHNHLPASTRSTVRTISLALGLSEGLNAKHRSISDNNASMYLSSSRSLSIASGTDGVKIPKFRVSLCSHACKVRTLHRRRASKSAAERLYLALQIDIWPRMKLDHIIQRVTMPTAHEDAEKTPITVVTGFLGVSACQCSGRCFSFSMPSLWH